MATWPLIDNKKKLPACSNMFYQPSLFNYKFPNSQGGPVLTNVPLSLDYSSYCNFMWKRCTPHPNSPGTEFNSLICIFLNMEAAVKIRKSCCLGKPLRSRKSSETHSISVRGCSCSRKAPVMFTEALQTAGRQDRSCLEWEVRLPDCRPLPGTKGDCHKNICIFINLA